MEVDKKCMVMNPIKPAQYANGTSSRFAGLNFNRVLVPVDFSVCTFETLRYAKALAEQFAAVVDVLHVVQFNSGRNHAAESALDRICILNEGVRRELRKTVGIIWANERKAQVSVQIREGRADEVILLEAAATQASLIIMGARHRSWLSRFWRRHTVKRVVQNSPCPVMVLRTDMTVCDVKGSAIE